jgi:hypothetical protein
MVPADDEHTSANEAKENTSTQKNFVEKLKFWKRCNKDENKPARLTHMPACLMKWWTPLLVAAILFSLSFISAWGWGWQWHWPSSNAMKLCMTITGAGFAFSAWQQRSHDNATNAKQARAAIERDDYWKRREQIYQLLGSENPGLRLGAVALLAELADSAAHSTLLNETEKRQLQRHIIDTLCLQIRHEGLNQNNEGTCEEHAKIQQSIIGIILRRINSISQRQQHANWSNEEIILDQCHIVSAIQIQEVISNARLSLNQTTFHKSLTIKRSQLPNLEWENAIFEQELFTVDSSTIKLTSPPLSIRRALFSNSIIHPSIGKDIEIELPPTVEQIRFEACCFIRQHCYCTSDCSCRSQQNTEQCTCKRCDRCPCTAVCKWATIKITTTNEHATVSTPTTPDLTITGCDVATINTTLTTPRISINITHNRIQEQILTIITSEFITNLKQLQELNNNTCLTIQWNHINALTISKPIQIEIQSSEPISRYINITFNMIQNPNDSSHFAMIDYNTHPSAPNHFSFDQVTEGNTRPRLIYPWKTGTGIYL